MKNLLVAKILNEIADILEMRDVEFKPRAYRKAARTVVLLLPYINAHGYFCKAFSFIF